MSPDLTDGRLPRPSELRALLRRAPWLLEPGLHVQPGVLEMGDGLRVKVHGVDAAGRPVLILRERDFGGGFCDDLLELVGRWGADPQRFGGYAARPEEVRHVVLSRDLPEGAARRLRLLQPVVAVRVRLLREAATPEGFPELLPALDPPLDAELLGAALLPAGRTALRRLLAAADALRPALKVEGGGWPLVLRGTDGPCLSLHERDGRLWAGAAGESGARAWPLDEERMADLAIDLLMRRQEAGRPEEEVTAGA